MGTRTLEARLTARLLALAGGVLVAVGVAAVGVTDRVLDQSDTDGARAQATAGRDAVARELAEGDPPEAAIAEVVEAARNQGVRLAVRHASPPSRGSSSSGILPELSPGGCATVADERGRPWRACASGDGPATVVAAIPIEAHRAAVRTLWRGMASVVAVALVALWLAVRGALRAPVTELRSLVGWTETIADGAHPTDPPPARTREIARLQAAFDALVRRLLESLARERANSAHIAHELRTPLTAISAELEDVAAADDPSRDAIARARGDVGRLADVIDAILVLSDGGRPVVGGEAIVNVADLARELAPSGARIDAPDEALVEGDERLVSLAARNLFDNARKYGEGARLVRVSREGPAIRLAVVDRGPGLDEVARARMFDRYWRGAADGEGRGLGLALVRAVAERHGGRAEAKTAADGHGLEVAMTLARVVGWND
jgi:signal transduction histidine kinase